MDRPADETEYALIILHQMREELTAQPELCDPKLLKRINEAIILIETRREVNAA